MTLPERVIEINPWWLPRLLGFGRERLMVSEAGLSRYDKKTARSTIVAPLKMGVLSVKKGVLWTTIEGCDAIAASGDAQDLHLMASSSGYRANDAERFIDTANRIAAAAHSAAAREALEGLQPQIERALEEFRLPGAKDQYLTHPRYLVWRNTYSQTADLILPNLKIAPASSNAVRQAKAFLEIWDRSDAARIERNAAWVQNQKRKHSRLFAEGMGYPLNEDQINSILYDEHRSLIVAGAGTGKTSTIVAKIKWVLAQGLSNASRIKSLAFNRKAANEIQDRIGGGGNDELASTFHSLGLSLVSEARGKKPRLTKLSDDRQLLQGFIRGCIDQGLSTHNTSQIVVEFLAYFRYPEPNPVPIGGSHEENRWADGHDIRSFTGVKLRSNSEAIIANWLTLNRFDWKYEADYKLDTATIQYGQYRPDFYLPEHDVYIEHWACNRAGDLPVDWNDRQQQRYKEGMQWKRELHRRQGTKLIETFSDVYGRHTIVSSLGDALAKLGIEPHPLRLEEITTLVSNDEIIKPVVSLVEGFLALYRESGLTYTSLNAKLDKTKDRRGRAFVAMFELIHQKYVEHLNQEQAIDFSDMIREASTALYDRSAKIDLDYLLIDEFQDISRGRAELIKAILAQNPDCRLVAVGDDWQSIYRFAGSDIQVMVNFKEEFGHTERTDLRKTHRFGTNLLSATSTFIQANPQQLKKTLTAARPDSVPCIEIISAESASKSVRARAALNASGDGLESFEYEALAKQGEAVDENTAAIHGLQDVLTRIAEEREDSTVLVLGRYRFLEDRLKAIETIPDGIKVTFSTVHKAKGLEGDYVVVLDVIAGQYGFPSEIEDDPIMSLVLSQEAGIPNAEERRLFYVALSRARYKSFVLTHNHKHSSFVDELESEAFRGLVIPSEASSLVAKCPSCGGSTLQLRYSKYGPFYGCSSDRCGGKALKCPSCGNAGLVRRAERFLCLFCEKAADPCPKCDHGYLIHRPAGKSSKTGHPYEAFDACSTNRGEPKFKCFTRACRCEN